jgi:hypothetical protein
MGSLQLAVPERHLAGIAGEWVGRSSNARHGRLRNAVGGATGSNGGHGKTVAEGSKKGGTAALLRQRLIDFIFPPGKLRLARRFQHQWPT